MASYTSVIQLSLSVLIALGRCKMVHLARVFKVLDVRLRNDRC